ncbi:MAG: hypothetical protein GY803_22405, partial [Chloroflexi bacterium]|nr:hypothetical protein [Chloroflexota bacterium]
LGDKDVKYLVADFPGSGALASIAVTTMKPLAVRLRSFGGSGGGNDVAVWFMALVGVAIVGGLVVYRRKN